MHNILKEEEESIPYKDRTRNPVATPEQQLVMYTAMDWFNTHLWTPQGEAARRWLTQFGVTYEHYEDNPYIGYAPPLGDERLLTQFYTHMDNELGEGAPSWHTPAKHVGLLMEDGEARIVDRLVFASIDTMGNVMWFQARTMDEEKLDRYVSAIRIKPHPFWLPIASTRFPGTCIVKSVKDVLILAPHHIPSVVLRPSLDLSLLKDFPGPFFHFLPPSPDGEEMAIQDQKQHARLERYCHEIGKEYFPILWEHTYESLNAWVRSEGVFTVYEMMARRLSH